MGTILRNEDIDQLNVDSVTVISLPASIVTIGGQQFTTTSDITMDITTSGAGGLDTGSVAADTLYYMYAINNSGTMFLTSSLSSSAPTGFTNFKQIGIFNTDGSSDIISVLTLGKGNWNSFDMIPSSNGTPPTRGTTTVDQWSYKQDGPDLVIIGTYIQTAAGTTGTGQYIFPFPLGLTRDPDRVTSIAAGAGSTTALEGTVVGDGLMVDNNSNLLFLKALVHSNNTHFWMSAHTPASGFEVIGAANGQYGDTAQEWSIELSIPILEFADL